MGSKIIPDALTLRSKKSLLWNSRFAHGAMAKLEIVFPVQKHWAQNKRNLLFLLE